jgi:hypothetical protein
MTISFEPAMSTDVERYLSIPRTGALRTFDAVNRLLQSAKLFFLCSNGVDRSGSSFADVWTHLGTFVPRQTFESTLDVCCAAGACFFMACDARFEQCGDLVAPSF